MKFLRKSHLPQGLSGLAIALTLGGCAALPGQPTVDTSSGPANPQPPSPGNAGTSGAAQNSNAACKQASASGGACDQGTSGNASQDLVTTEAQTPLPLFPDLLQQANHAAAPHDATIWSEIRSGFGLPSDTARPRVQAELNWYSQHAAYLERVTARAEPYLYYILQQLHKRHMPTELALLPVVESAFIPYAYSSSQAAGIWQFTPSTGLHFGLKQNWWYDGRRDIYASTNAALDYLQLLHNQFGSWLLALAAYNSGAGTVEAAIRYNQARHQPTDFWNLDLPAETRHYVPKLLAVKAIVANPQKYAVQLWPIPNKPYLAVVDLKSQIDMSLAAKLANIPLKELYLLNPGYNRWATDPDGPHRLLLPASRVTKFETALAKIPSSQRVTWIRHRVHSGDTLSQIALEYHTRVSIIRQTNHLHGNLIHVGQYLIVPRSSAPYGAYAVASNVRHTGNPLAKRANKRVFTIHAGDTLWALANRYGVSVGQLAHWNGIGVHATLRPGRKLVIWSRPMQYASAAPTASVPVHASRKGGKQVYTVQPGDNLWNVASRYGVSVQQLAQWNGIGPRTTLHPGRKLVIESKPPVQVASASSAPSPQGATGQGDKRVYTLRPGDNLWNVARQFGVSVQQLARWNGIGTHATLHPGRKLVIWNKPVQVASTASNGQASAPQGASDQGLKHVYTLRPGDNLWNVARQFGVSVQQLAQWNGIGTHATLHPGRKLVIWNKPVQVASAASSTSTGQSVDSKHVYTVQSGDNLWNLARRFGVSVKQLARWNGIGTHTTLHPGRKLLILGKSVQVASAGSNTATSTAQGTSGHGQNQVYTVQPGDNLWNLASRYGVSVQKLAHWNGITTRTPLKPGQKLVIHANSVQYASASASGQGHSNPQAATGKMHTVSYKVRQGDSLYSIAQHFGVGVPQIRRWNDLGHGTLLHPGQPLKLRVDVTQAQNES